MPHQRSVAIEDIQIGRRRRDDYGDIAGLAESIERFGLLHPPVVDDQMRLVAGGRRIEAAKSLGWQSIEVRLFGDLSEAELREIELEENLRRKDLTTGERSKTLLRLVEQASEVDRSLASDLRAESARKSERGRPEVPGSIRRVSERIGIPESTIRAAQAHVASIDKYPELAPLPQRDATTIGKKLDAMPAPERTAAREAIVRNEPNILAKLTDRPPLPAGPTPHEQAANDPGVRFVGKFHDLIVFFNSVRNHGGLAQVSAAWPEGRKSEMREHVCRVIELATEWRDILSGGLPDVETDDDTGRVSGTHPSGDVGDDRRPRTAA